MEKQWYEFIEHNDWEGESWSFYVQLDEKELAHLKSIIEDNEFYEISERVYTIAEVDLLVDTSRSGYMNYHNKVIGTNGDILGLTAEIIEEDDPFYKGQFWVLD